MSGSTRDEPQDIPTEVDDAPAVEPDVQSDPARDVSDDTDWSTEGGATPSGAATETGARDEEEEPEI